MIHEPAIKIRQFIEENTIKSVIGFTVAGTLTGFIAAIRVGGSAVGIAYADRATIVTIQQQLKDNTVSKTDYDADQKIQLAQYNTILAAIMDLKITVDNQNKRIDGLFIGGK